MKMGRCDSDSVAICVGVLLYIAAAVGGSLLIFYNDIMVCPPCVEWYTNVTSGGVAMCVGNGTTGAPEAPYQQCHQEYHEPGFAFGCLLVSICICIIAGFGGNGTIVFLDIDIN